MLDAYAIFAHTRSAVASVAYPRAIAYAIVVSGLDGNVPRVDHYHAIVNTESGQIRLRSISDEAAAKPATPHGFNAAFVLRISGGRGSKVGGPDIAMGRPAATEDILGVPAIAPQYDFGIVAPYSQRHESNETSLPVIASVASSRRDYDVTLVGPEQINGQATIHISLRPKADAHKYRLRELWVDANTYLPVRAIVAGNFTLAPMTDVAWTIDFQQIGSSWYVAKEAPLATLYLSHHKVVRDASITFDNITATGGPYGPMFEPNASPTTLVEP
jgi:hypothetical protein